MMTVIKQDSAGKITGWMMGHDLPELRRRAEQTFDHDLAGFFYRMELTPPRGKHEIEPGVTMLVE